MALHILLDFCWHCYESRHILVHLIETLCKHLSFVVFKVLIKPQGKDVYLLLHKNNISLVMQIMFWNTSGLLLIGSPLNSHNADWLKCKLQR